MGIFIGIYYSA